MPNIFTEKAGPLPVWAWMGIATAGILGFAAIKGKGSGSSSAAQQQQLAAEEAALANAAGSAATSGNNSAGTYGSGHGTYGGNGYTGNTAGSYSTTPAASTTAASSAASPDSSQQFLAAFQATGQNAGQIVPGGTGLPTAPAPVAGAVPKGSTAPGSAAWTNTYVVKKGDTLASIAARFGTSVALLAHNNVYVAGEAPGKAPGTTLGTGAGLKTGQVLKVP